MGDGHSGAAPNGEPRAGPKGRRFSRVSHLSHHGARHKQGWRWTEIETGRKNPRGGVEGRQQPGRKHRDAGRHREFRRGGLQRARGVHRPADFVMLMGTVGIRLVSVAGLPVITVIVMRSAGMAGAATARAGHDPEVIGAVARVAAHRAQRLQHAHCQDEQEGQQTLFAEPAHGRQTIRSRFLFKRRVPAVRTGTSPRRAARRARPGGSGGRCSRPHPAPAPRRPAATGTSTRCRSRPRRAG